MDGRQQIIASASLCVIYSGLILQNKLKKRNKKRWWMASHMRGRDRYSGSHMLAEFLKEPSGYFENFCRMRASDFEFLLTKIGPSIQNQDTNMRLSVPIDQRVANTLRFLATGDSYRSLGFLFKCSRQTVANCVEEVCKTLIRELRDEIKIPETEGQWLQEAIDFEKRWNFPHCVGAMDGKHVVIEAPKNSATEYYNYKGTFSIVLFALVNANYLFTFADIGCQGRISDGGVFRNTVLFKKLDSKELHLPPAKSLPPLSEYMPYVTVADDAFALSPNIMKPYPGVHAKGSAERIFNYRLSRARRIVENAFGIMVSVFRVFRKPMLLEPEKASSITMTCVLLHNFLRKSKISRSSYSPPGTFDSEENGGLISGSWRRGQDEITSLLPLQNQPRKASLAAKAVRDNFSEYFQSNDGKIPWQDDQ